MRLPWIVPCAVQETAYSAVTSLYGGDMVSTCMLKLWWHAEDPGWPRKTSGKKHKSQRRIGPRGVT